ncbi:glutamine--fructose-6-phosphate transaminase (isomerizing) [Aquirhabdus sp.]|uniref:glutamine--fructose-6-phosphate transaminase (isomerizing) n=1 Tax=Aquirhabdus sp. TaxID=2824160 RepID=UPI00396CF735
MCGIVGGIAERNVAPILVEGLKRLEYRGYDSAGVALIDHGDIIRERQVGKVAVLENAVIGKQLHGALGIAHTRWATHGEPSVINAHPHTSGTIAVVHNGIIENYAVLKAELQAEGFVFTSQTDTEVVAHLIHRAMHTHSTLLAAVQSVIPLLHGAYALGVVSSQNADELIAVRAGSPLVVGLGIGENFVASDQMALLPVTNRFIYLEEKDVVRLTRDNIEIYQNGVLTNRTSHEIDASDSASDKGGYKHYMLKEIHEQTDAITRTLAAGITGDSLHKDFLGEQAHRLAHVKQIQIIACGTSFHAGMVARYWFEKLLKLPCQVEIASEFRYREPVVLPNTLLVCISQSGETADTLAALRDVKAQSTLDDNLLYLALCNVKTSSLIRETDLHLLTQAGVEIGVASTKAFTTQLAALMLLVLKVGQEQNRLTPAESASIIEQLWHVPNAVNEALALDPLIEKMSHAFVERRHALFLGRGIEYPIALEGALKLKEISYIHAEGYAAGELKHGPLALVDKDMPVVVLAAQDDLLDKLKSNMQEVQARGGELFVFADVDSEIKAEERVHVLYVPKISGLVAPIVYSIPMQLLSYHVAVLRGTDVDQPRNLAKSVTVE